VVVVAVLGIGLGLQGCTGGKGGGSQGTGGAAAGGTTAAAGSGGAAGASGAAGTAGAAGTVGAAGASGAAGTAGAAGSTGAAGRGGTGGQAGTGGTMVTGAGGAFCGNGVVDPGEGCDDGNAQTADGCSPTCRKIVGLPVGYGPPCALLDDGGVKCWGYNYYGELGLGDMVNRGIHASDMGANLPTVDLGTGRSAVALTAGAGNGTCALLDNATVKCWGPNSVGNLGLGDKNPHGDMPGEMGDNLPAIDLGTGHTAKAIASSGFHTCAILENGSVK
jgi:cysteine-rich repeat protein